MQLRTLLAAGVAALAMATSASAAINAPIPTSAYITVGTLDWAWAGPIAGDDDVELIYQSQWGWRLPTALELASAPTATSFLKPTGNVPYGGVDPVSGARFTSTLGDYTGAAACATPYFTSLNNCDWLDGDFGFWAGKPGYISTDDQLYVRTHSDIAPTGPVPEPSTWAMLIIGFGALGVAMRRRRAVA